MTPPELIHTFQLAILDLSAILETDRNTLPGEDADKINYIVGMAAVNAFNLGQVMERGEVYYRENHEKVDRLIQTATDFAEALKQEGFNREQQFDQI